MQNEEAQRKFGSRHQSLLWYKVSPPGEEAGRCLLSQVKPILSFSKEDSGPFAQIPVSSAPDTFLVSF